MSAALVLTGAGLVSWVLRVLFIVLVPARRLPPRVHRALPYTGPAALAALLATGLARSGSGGGSPPAVLLALLAAALVARRTRSLLLATGAGVGAFALLTL
jgi:branched-subunit amino acid transport protein